MKSESPLREFRPALRFLSIFVAVYFLCNVLYGIYVESFNPAPDPTTVWVTGQVAYILSKFEAPVTVVISQGEPTVLLNRVDKTVLRVFEGCNGLNVMIVFVAFLIAFGGKIKNILLYTLMGFLILHLANLLRIILLFETALHRPLYFFYFHKYFFTAILYLVVFALWIQWTRMKSVRAVVEA